MNNSELYYEKTKDNSPRPLLLKALPFVHTKEHALDIGSGALNDSKYLLSNGFKKVTALDKWQIPDPLPIFPDSTFEYIISSFEDFEFPLAVYDFVNAQFSLPFISPTEFSRVFQSILQSLKTGGIFSGQLFGDRDDWNSNPRMTFHTRAQGISLFEEMHTIHFEEEEKDENTAIGVLKHWHVFNFIVKKC